MNENSNPWRKLKKPSDRNSYTIRRVSEDVKWNIFWAIDYAGNELLIMEFSSLIDVTDKLPKLQGLDIRVTPSPLPHKHIIRLQLLDSNNSDIFFHLCSDMILTVNLVETEEGAVKSFLMRTWRWHRMLAKGGKYKKLSPEEQENLIAEFYVLDHILFPAVGIDTSVRVWKSPLDALHDFEIDKVHLEVKTRKGSPDSKISISSASQLDLSGIDKLYLHVSEVNKQVQSDEESFTIIDLAEKIKNRIVADSPIFLDMYLQKLYSVGLDLNHDYSEDRWQFGNHDLYEVTEDFPKITPEMYSDGVVDLEYKLLVKKCKRFKINIEDLRKEISANEINN